MNKEDKLKIGLFGIGLRAYWDQFPGLEERLKGYLLQVCKKLENFNAQYDHSVQADSQ